MSLDLTTYASLQSNLFVELIIEKYRTSAGSGFTTQTLRFSDRLTPYTISGQVYTGLGKLLSITNSSSELRATPFDVTVTLSGIPNTSIAEIIHSRIKGSTITISRGLFNANTEQLLAVSPNPVGRFKGYVNNYSLNEDYDADSRTSTNTIVLICSSTVSLLQNKISGRRTNPESQKRFYSTDVSMDRVPVLKDSYFDFGGTE